MARPREFNDFEISKFNGLDLRSSTELLPEKTLSKCINFEIGALGELRKRPGILRQSSGTTLTPATGGVKILGDISNSTVHQLLVQTDTGSNSGKVYKSEDSGVSWAQISTPAATAYSCGKCIQYAGNLTIPSTSGINSWNGAVWTNYPSTPKSNYRCVVLQDRIFMIENVTRNILFSDPANAASWPAANNIGYSVEDRDLLVGLINYRDRLVTLRQNSINVIYLNGPPSSWTLKQLPFNIGVPNEDCAVVYNDLLYLLSYDGVYRTDLTQMEEISKPIAPLFAKRRYASFYGVSSKYQDTMAYYNGRLFCSFLTDYVSNNKLMIFNIKTNTWTEWLPNITSPGGFTFPPFRDMFSMQIGRRVSAAPYQKEGIYMSTADDGRIFLFDDQNLSWYDDQSGSLYTLTARTKATNVDLPSEWKRCVRFSIRAHRNVTAQNITGLYSINGVDTTPVNILIGSNPNQTRIKGPGWFRSLAFEISDTSNGYFEVEDFVVSIKRKNDLSETKT